MSHFIRFGTVATILGLLVTSGLSGSGPTIAVASDNQRGRETRPVVLTLPAGAGTVHVTAEGPYGLGHPVATFIETVR